MNQLDPFYKTFWLKFWFGVIWGHKGQKLIFTKNATPTYYIALTCDVAHADAWGGQLDPPLQNLSAQISIWGHSGQKVIFTKNAITCPCYIARP